jgi:hypothetical protein
MGGILKMNNLDRASRMAWGSVRVVLEEEFSFSEVKKIIALAGLDVSRLSHLSQKGPSYTSKGELMSSIDYLFSELSSDAAERFVHTVAEEICERSETGKKKVEDYCERYGYPYTGLKIEREKDLGERGSQTRTELFLAEVIKLLEELSTRWDEFKSQPERAEFGREKLRRWKDNAVQALNKYSPEQATTLRDHRYGKQHEGYQAEYRTFQSEVESYKNFLIALRDDIEVHPDYWSQQIPASKQALSDNSIRALTRYDEDLSDTHRQILEYVYHVFGSEGRWVSSRNLVHDLYTLGDAYEIAKDIGPDLIRVEDPDRKEDALAKLTLKGVSLCEDWTQDLSDFVSVLRLFVRTYIETRDGRPQATEDDFIKKLGLSKLQARKMTLLALEEGGLYKGASYGGAEPPRFDLDRRILKFRDVDSIEDYFAIRDRDRAQPLAASSGDQVRQEPPLYDVFISYSHKDEELARELRQLLESKGLKCFMSSMDIRSGDPWTETIRNALVDAQEILLVITPDSVDSKWVLCEGGAGWALGKRMVPALLKVEPDLLPEPIKRHQAKKIDTTTQRESLAKEIAERMGKYLE